MNHDFTTLRATWTFPTTIRFGSGSITLLPKTCAEQGMQRPLLVSDPGLSGTPMVAAMLEDCRKAGLGAEIFAQVKPNPTGGNVEAGLAAFRAGSHDGVVVVGGGSAMDAGKVIAFMAGQSLPLWHFDDNGPGWKDAAPEGIAPIIAVPTTAGTGSEVGRAGVIVNEETHQKIIIFHPKMLPAVVIQDPRLTIGLPPHLTAATGIDAFTHCLEAYCAPGFHPLAEGVAVEGMRLVKEYLPRAYKDGTDIEARGQMLIAASMGATAFQKGLGGIHSISHPVGARYDTHHGLTNAVVMPYVLVFNRPAVEGKIGRLAAFLSIAGGFDGFLDWVLAFRRDLGIPHTLAEIGVDAARAEEIGKYAAIDPTAGSNPVPLDAAILQKLFEDAVAGRL
jgi:alcohol dehydrogenase class IV